jgi:lipopolysaccharide/colanic/teichoic acid biosynthesis glycosyltransferase
MPPPKHADLPVAPNKAAVPPTTPSLPSYEQQQVQLQQQQLQIMQQQAMNTKKTRQSIDAVFWFVVICVVGPILLIIAAMLFDSISQALGF